MVIELNEDNTSRTKDREGILGVYPDCTIDFHVWYFLFYDRVPEVIRYSVILSISGHKGAAGHEIARMTKTTCIKRMYEQKILFEDTCDQFPTNSDLVGLKLSQFRAV